MEFEEVFHFSATFLAGAGVACMTLGSLDNTRSRETCEFCRDPLDPDVNFCPCAGYLVYLFQKSGREQAYKNHIITWLYGLPTSSLRYPCHIVSIPFGLSLSVNCFNKHEPRYDVAWSTKS